MLRNSRSSWPNAHHGMMYVCLFHNSSEDHNLLFWLSAIELLNHILVSRWLIDRFSPARSYRHNKSRPTPSFIFTNNTTRAIASHSEIFLGKENEKVVISAPLSHQNTPHIYLCARKEYHTAHKSHAKIRKGQLSQKCLIIASSNHLDHVFFVHVWSSVSFHSLFSHDDPTHLLRKCRRFKLFSNFSKFLVCPRLRRKFLALE